MKKILFYFCLILPVCAFGQALTLGKHQPFNGDHIITAVDSNDTYVWVGTNKGIFRIGRKHKRKKFYSLSDTGSPANYVTSLYCLSDGCVWIGTNNGLLKYDNYGFILFAVENSDLPEDLIVSVSAGKDNDLLVGTAHHGIMRMHKNRFHVQPGDNDRTLQTKVSVPK